MDFALLKKQDDKTSQGIIERFEKDETFHKLAVQEMERLIKRDDEDDEKLAKGVQISVKKGVIPPHVDVEPVKKIDVNGRTADDVADEIVKSIQRAPGEEGCLLVMQGRSGTGKGTTVEKLRQKLPKAVTWSNGNVFRSLTLLVVTHCEQKGEPFSPSVLTVDLVGSLMKYLRFGKFDDGKYDIEIDGLGIKARVSQIATTKLMEPRVAVNIPAVAQETQGEVINFASQAVTLLIKEGHSVLLEGRAQTVNYIRSPNRVELIMSKPEILGARRLAQRIAAAALNTLKAKGGEPLASDVEQALVQALAQISQEGSK